MKRVLIIVFAFFYLLLSVGFSMNAHLCGGHLKTISFFHPTDEADCCGKMEAQDDCCNDVSTFIKVQDQQHAGTCLSVNPDLNVIHLNSTSVFELIFCPITKSESFHVFYSPPILYEQAIYLRDRVLII
jgi:hypothetical protein